MKTKQLLVYVLIIALTFACDEVTDCLFFSVKPELPSKTFAIGTVDVPYEDSFRASVKNDPNDEDYIYYFSVSGNLPPGLDAWVNNRTLTIEGIPTSSGTYIFNVLLEIEYAYDDDSERICFADDTVQRSYSITIND